MLTVKDRLFTISDIHVPYHNKTATKHALSYIKQERPEIVNINGDAIDFYAISRYSRDPKRRMGLVDELRGFTEFLSEVRDAAPKARIMFVLGNHEIRWTKYIRDHAPELEGVPRFTLAEALQLDKFKITLAPSGFIFGNCYIVHGDGLLGSKAGTTVTKWMDRYMASCVVGHIHRLAIVHRRTAANERLFGVETGTLSSLDPSYEMTAFADWQVGFSSLTRYTNGIIVPSLYEIIKNDIYKT